MRNCGDENPREMEERESTGRPETEEAPAGCTGSGCGESKRWGQKTRETSQPQKRRQWAGFRFREMR